MDPAGAQQNRSEKSRRDDLFVETSQDEPHRGDLFFYRTLLRSFFKGNRMNYKQDAPTGLLLESGCSDCRHASTLRTEMTCQQAFADAAQLVAFLQLLPDLLGAGLPLLEIGFYVFLMT